MTIKEFRVPSAAVSFTGILMLFSCLFATSEDVIAARLPSVSVAVADASAVEGADNAGLFQIRRDCCSSGPLTVNLRITGTGTNGVDYASISSTVTISASASSVPISISAIDDLLEEGS